MEEDDPTDFERQVHGGTSQEDKEECYFETF